MENQIESSSDFVSKFESFRMIAEKINRKYKDAQNVIERLTEEINISRETENNVRKQLNRVQEKTIELQKLNKEMKLIKEKNLENEERCQSLEMKVQQLVEIIAKIKGEVSKFLEMKSKEDVLINKYKDLELLIKKKEGDYDFLQMEFQILKKDKNDIINEYEERARDSQNELNKCMREIIDVKKHSDEILLMYRKQITDYEQTIRRFEEERSSLIGEFQFPLKTTANNKGLRSASDQIDTAMVKLKRVTREDNTTVHPKERPSLMQEEVNLLSATEISEMDKTNRQMKSENYVRNSNSPDFEMVEFIPKTKASSKASNKFPRTGVKTKRPLDVITQKQNESNPNSEDELRIATKKRKLYSTNYNHYFG